jgi:hypothetical protein
MKTKNLIHLSVYIAGGYLGYLLCILIFEDSPSREAYGLLGGWWMAAYYANFFNLKITLIKYLLVLWIIVLLVDLILDKGFFYDGGSEGDPIGYSLMTVLQFCVAISPLVFNSINNQFKLLLQRKFSAIDDQ